MRHTNHTFQTLICSLIISASCLHGGVKLQVRDGRPIVDGVYVNGHGPWRFLVDTGANVNLIETGLARKIGMSATSQTALTSAAGKVQVAESDGNEVTLDSAAASGQKFVISGLDAIHNSSPDVQGVLGQWFLARFDYTLDLHAKRLEFGKQDRAGTRTTFKMINARPVVSTSLGDLALDSGATRVTLFGIRADGGGEFRMEFRTVAGAQKIDGRRIWNGDALAIPGRPEPGVDGLLPLGLFKSVYVSNSESYMILE
jgi:hypothetical protein